MMRAVLVGLLVVVGMTAEAGPRAPRFADFGCGKLYRGKVAPLRLDTPVAVQFEEDLRRSLKSPPDFGCRYRLFGRLCGGGCASPVVLDLSTGRSHFPSLEVLYYEKTFPPFTFEPGSRLLKVKGALKKKPAVIGAHYFKWEGSRWKFVKYVAEPLKKFPCADFRFGSCPPHCREKCVPSACDKNGGRCTADCNGPGSCVEK